MVDVPKATIATGGGSGALYKVYGLIGLTTVIGAIAGYLLNSGELAYGATALIAFLTLFILEAIFIGERNHLMTAVVLNTLAFALPFLRLFSLPFLGALALFAVFMLHGAYRGKRVIDNMVKIRFPRLVYVITTSLITAVIIFLSTMLILSSNFSIKKERVDQIINLSAPVMDRFVDGFTPEMETGAFLTSFAERDAASSEEFQALPESQKRLVIDRSIANLETRINDFLGVDVNLDVSVSENIHEIAETKLSLLTPRARLYWSIVAIAVIWLSVESVKFLIFIPLTVLAFLAYELLFALGFAALQMESRSKEIISLK